MSSTVTVEHICECKPCSNCYSVRGCRCDACRASKTKYSNAKRRLRARPDSGWDNPRVPIDRTQNHLLFLASKGISLGTIEKLTGIKKPNLSKYRLGAKSFIMKKTQDKIIAIPALPEYRDKSTRVTVWNDKMDRPKYKLGKE